MTEECCSKTKRHVVCSRLWVLGVLFQGQQGSHEHNCADYDDPLRGCFPLCG